MKTRNGVPDKLSYGGRENTIKHNYTGHNGGEFLVPMDRTMDPTKKKDQWQQFIVATLIVFVFPLITFAQLPNLGTSADFVLFTKVI